MKIGEFVVKIYKDDEGNNLDLKQPIHQFSFPRTSTNLFKVLIDKQELDVKLNLLVNEIAEIYLEVYKSVFPKSGPIENPEHNKVFKNDFNKTFIFDKLLKRELKAFDK